MTGERFTSILEKKVMLKRASWSALLLALGVAVQPGCEPSAQPADSDRARATLREALDAWQEGQTPEEFRGRSAVTAVESKWQAGYRLLGYEMIGDGETSGFDWQCKVRLSLQSAGGQKSQEKAIYSISTAPAVVIVRSEGS
jgi:hypothetical protein